ncbi:MAG: protein phosphatase CheZ [Thiohalophilus sp.]|uniref:protein phosphatase CheZ n=1 Tax=Thiohalophilus sp. TaxID=3028392 RepID=UPI00286FE77C|nr:protein phosphatase CheZ [Thiohalophilus sp.]MDR9436650.1 protein phosphatase CheZ [Thiohalophilus sp.]
MSDNNFINDENIARVRDLLASMENGDEEGAKEVVDDLTSMRESTLYQEMGKLTRELHDAISAFGMDDRITDIAEHDIPDARERLNYVIQKTDEAANRTLEAVEESFPLCEEIENQAADLNNQWQRFTNRELSADEFRALSSQLGEYLGSQSEKTVVLKDNLNKVLMAQDFQDLTGQIIKKVIKLVEEVEDNLVELIKLAGLPEHEEQQQKRDSEKLAGPVVPGVDDIGDSVSGQDEVDDLLSSLGF